MTQRMTARELSPKRKKENIDNSPDLQVQHPDHSHCLHAHNLDNHDHSILSHKRLLLGPFHLALLLQLLTEYLPDHNLSTRLRLRKLPTAMLPVLLQLLMKISTPPLNKTNQVETLSPTVKVKVKVDHPVKRIR